MNTFHIPVFGNLISSISSVDLFCNRDIKKPQVAEISINHIALSFPDQTSQYEAVWEVHCNFCTSIVPETRIPVGNQICFERCIPMANFRVLKAGKTYSYSKEQFQRVSQIQDHLQFSIIDAFTQEEIKENIDIYMIVAVRVCEDGK